MTIFKVELFFMEKGQHLPKYTVRKIFKIEDEDLEKPFGYFDVEVKDGVFKMIDFDKKQILKLDGSYKSQSFGTCEICLPKDEDDVSHEEFLKEFLVGGWKLTPKSREKYTENRLKSIGVENTTKS